MQVCQGTWLHDGLSRRVVEKFVHEDFNPGNHEEFLIRDISLLKVSTKITKDNRSIDNFFRKKIIIIDKIYYQCNFISFDWFTAFVSRRPQSTYLFFKSVPQLSVDNKNDMT